MLFQFDDISKAALTFEGVHTFVHPILRILFIYVIKLTVVYTKNVLQLEFRNVLIII